jgi:hypothetical protein
MRLLVAIRASSAKASGLAIPNRASLHLIAAGTASVKMRCQRAGKAGEGVNRRNQLLGRTMLEQQFG